MKKYLIFLTAAVMALVSCTREGVKVSTIEMDPLKKDLIVGETFLIKATPLPVEAENKTITWTSSDETVATVSNGTVTAITVGQASIRAAVGDVYKECEVTVADIPVESVTIEAEDVTLAPEETLRLSATVLPSEAASLLSYSSSDEKIATVDATGMVKAIAEGTCKITASAGDKSDVVNVTVKGEVSFQFDLQGINGMSVDKIIITPSDETITYFPGIILASKVNELYGSIENVLEFDKSWFEFIAQYSGTTWYEEMFPHTVKGILETTGLQLLDYLEWGSEYYLYAYGFDAEGNQTTDVHYKLFETATPAPSENKISVEVIRCEDKEVEIKVTTTNEDPYFITAQRDNYVEHWEDPEEMFRELVHSLNDGGVEPYIHTGSQNITLNVGKPESKYYVIIRGFDEGPTTELQLIEFTTGYW